MSILSTPTASNSTGTPVSRRTSLSTRTSKINITEKLNFKNPQIYVQSFARKNLSYIVHADEDKHKKLLKIVNNVPGSGLVYVRNRRETTEIALFLKRNGIVADFYHAGIEREERFKKQADWKQNVLRVMVATNAFGMGIDKPDVRFVVHLDLPESLEAYYQEAGRAGRDGKRAYAVLLANRSDQIALETRYLNSFPSVDEIKKTYHYLGNYFQLAFGAGEGLSFNFELAEFCKRFNLSVIKTLSALKFLEREGYIALSENVFLPSRVLFLMGNEDVYRFQIEQAGYDPIIKAILRSYGGAFEHYVKVNEADIAKKIRASYNDVIRLLSNLQEQEILSYLPQSDEPQLTYIRARVDYLHLDIDARFVEFRKKIQTDKIKAVLAYAGRQQCRNIQLLIYFDEPDAVKCGVCDVCLEDKKNNDTEQFADQIDFEIATLLQSQSYTLPLLVNSIKKGSESDKIERIRELLDAGKIKTDGKNYYL
ncbi:MAG: RecQ family ATP-dependent DNA helicase [Pedobacter sp.]|nr:MAG: RecQ family ATP-dependent DNA helicase [Pedobacter sp.]